MFKSTALPVSFARILAPARPFASRKAKMAKAPRTVALLPAAQGQSKPHRATRTLAKPLPPKGSPAPAVNAVMLRPSPEDTMASYIARRRRHMTILVCQHKRTFCEVRSLMHDEGQRTFFGQRIDGVVYGQNGAFAHAGVLPAFERHACTRGRTLLMRLLRRPKVRYLYWGDVDSSSVDQIMKVYRANPGTLIRPFMPAYRCMLDRALGRKLRQSDGQPASPFSVRLAKRLDPRRRNTFESVLASDLSIPQHLVDKQILRARKAG